MTPQVTIAADMEFNADEFWTEFNERFPNVAAALALHDEATVDIDVWRRIQDLDGFDAGPAHARCALFAIHEVQQ